MGVQARLGLSRLRLEKAWRRGAWKAATATPQRQGLAQQLYARRARGVAIKEKRHPSYFISARGPPRMFHSGPGLQAFQTENLGREKPTTRCPGSIRAECAPQRDVVFAQRGPFFWSTSGAQEKPHCYWSEKAAFPEDAEPGLQQRRCLSPSRRTASSDAWLCCANLQAVKTPSNSEEKNPNAWLWFRLALKMPSNQRVKRSSGVFLVSPSCKLLASKASECFPRDQNIKFVLDKCA